MVVTVGSDSDSVQTGEGDQVADGLIHRKDAAGQRAIRQPGVRFRDDDLELVELIAAGTHTQRQPSHRLPG